MRMGFQESVEYILFKNPVITGTAEAIKVIGKVVPGSLLKPKAEIATTAVMPALKNVVLTGSPFIRLAGIFGASAVALGAYGAHNVYPTVAVCGRRVPEGGGRRAEEDIRDGQPVPLPALVGSAGSAAVPLAQAEWLAAGAGHVRVLRDVLLPRPVGQQPPARPHSVGRHGAHLRLARHGAVSSSYQYSSMK
ncbi:uncharacterized protein LOC134532174 isoform X1 [Bacillus rossius redtenbacheri]|uniref:uncharacterized protein LOC134532174 isoform X1 n=1 Tax=Bacillus rossius redtenbacheri TaxID=93214 RepID=UPI002FDE5063